VVKDYIWIRKWGEVLHSNKEYIEAEVQRAIATDAPDNAIYFRHNGTWATTDNIVDKIMRIKLGLLEIKK
jgi:hypothetical protein